MAQRTKMEEQKLLDVAKIIGSVRMGQFKGAPMYVNDVGYWQPLGEDRLRRLAYELLGNPGRTRVNEVWDYVQYGTPDLTKYAQYIRMGELVRDTVAVDFTVEIPAEDCVYATSTIPDMESQPSEFILDLAKGNEGVYGDILQSIAPIFMKHKPAGVIWWKGMGANGKTTLAQVLYDLFPNFMANLTVKQIEDERDAPVLNGMLANVVKESSEGYIQDSKAYKSIGTHEAFPVHKFHSQQSVMIDGDLHHIFSANNIPTFGDKSDGAKRRTLLIPFDAKFPDDPTFIERTFTPEFYAQHLGLFLHYAKRLKEQGYHYEFSDHSTQVKEKYDTGTNSAVTYLEELFIQNIFGFDNYGVLYVDYENWCIDNGYSNLSRQQLRRAAEDKNFKATTIRNDEGSHSKRYAYEDFTFKDLERVGGLRLGLYQEIGASAPVIVRPAYNSQLQEFLDAIPE